ncbi:hypothetical protein TL16_g03607 [Triparma laevis f. inornata]|uniref:peptidylprolyl isomerase n=2 Tax=Triparma laevis TaxID=1534972 RepID=A0A9W7FFV0_9STRA|nr:hypothetical protein TL16_g03607 [Triparma laevis f. inornata]GMI11355.1 hypothetical protein TrLO_g7778 [Triparma laevis f. longispina]
MQFTVLFLLVLLVSAVAAGKKKKLPEKNLPPDAQLRIGVKHRPDTCDRKTKAGDRLSMHYTGTIYTSGIKFDSSLDRSSPFEFNLGRGEVIQGWDRGLSNMCIGEKRKLTIPSDLGYGETGAGNDIKAGDTLLFEVELLDILNKQKEL